MAIIGTFLTKEKAWESVVKLKMEMGLEDSPD